MNATIITIGDELLIGQVLNTNSAWLAAELTAIGFTVTNHVSISDKSEHIVNALDYYLASNNLLILTGGLGPTNDDITKKVLADYFNTELIFSEEILADVEARIAAFGSQMNDKNREQALVPKDAVIMRNNHGTAPGMWFEHYSNSGSRRIVISLPGVPREMKGIFSDHIKSALIDFFKLPAILYKTVMLTGIAEAQLAEKLEDWEESLPVGMSLAYLPSPEAIRLRLGFTATDGDEAQTMLQSEIDKLHGLVPEHIYGYDNESIESVTGRMIAERGGILCCAESCTGGTIAQKITALPGCSAWFSGGVIAYSNEIKQKVLGVSEETLKEHGAVSEETVTEMVLGAKRVFNADYAVATSGVAGPSGGTKEKPVGTVWIAAAGPDFLVTKRHLFGKDRSMNIRHSATAAFSLLRTAMLKK